MRIFEQFLLRFEKPDWSKNPEFGLLDTILEQNPHLIELVRAEVVIGNKPGKFGRQDVPSVEQIVRAGIFKEIRGLDYRGLEYAQSDSRICEVFLKLDQGKPYSFSTWQKYISRISEVSLHKLLVEINKVAIESGLEDIDKLRTDTTVVESNIHYPTNNSLVWDCIRESHRLLSKLAEQCDGLKVRDYKPGAKKNFFTINNTRSKDKRVLLFKKQLTLFTKSINQVSRIVKKKASSSIKEMALLLALEQLLPLMEQVFDFTQKREIKGEKVPNDQKLFSIYELHTDIIVKGLRKWEFGHKVSLTSGKSNLLLDVQIHSGNPSDSTLLPSVLDRTETNYGKSPRSLATDGGYASLKNVEYARGKGIVNIVFNKVVGSLKSVATTKNMETRLKKWRSGIEAVISNYKRKFKMFRCNWKGREHFDAKVLWAALAYNIRVMTGLLIQKIEV